MTTEPDKPEAVDASKKQEQGGSPPCFLTEEDIDPDYLGLPVASPKPPVSNKQLPQDPAQRKGKKRDR